MTVSDYIFDFLHKKECGTVFMVSGSSAMWLVDALKRNGMFKVICNHHEQVCAMSAEIYARVSGKMGVALVTAGPGVMNALTGVAGAWTDSVPVLVISGQSGLRFLQYEEQTGIRQHGTQGVNIRGIVEPVTKYFAVIDDPSKIRYYLEKACHIAVSGRPGPVWLDVPVNIQNMQVPENMEGFKPEPEKEELPENVEVKEAWNLLCKAKRPLILAGHGVRIAGAAGLLRKLYSQCGIPVVTSRLGIDLIESDNPLFAGRPGSYGDRCSHFAIQNSDFILIIGSRLSLSTIGYYPARFGQHAKKVLVDIDHLELGKKDVPIDLKINCDCKAFLNALLDIMDCSEMKDLSKWQEKCLEWRQQYPVVLPEYRACEPVNSYYLSEVISKKAGKGDIIVVDTGSGCNVVSQSFCIKEDQRYIISGGMSCMGYWAGAIGACMSDPSGNVIAIAGDGSLQMNIQEMATLKYNKLPLKLFVISNKGYLLIRLNQHNYMNDRFLGVGPDSGLEIPNIVSVAEAYGIKAVRIEKLSELEAGIEEVLNYKGPVICEVVSPEFQSIMPRIASREMPDGSLKACEFDDLYPFLSDEELQKNRLTD